MNIANIVFLTHHIQTLAHMHTNQKNMMVSGQWKYVPRTAQITMSNTLYWTHACPTTCLLSLSLSHTHTHMHTHTHHTCQPIQFTSIKYSFSLFGGEYGHGKWIQENIIFMRFCCCFKLSKKTEKLLNEQLTPTNHQMHNDWPSTIG